MQIVGSNFRVNVSVKNGTIVSADRPVRYMKGWPLQRVLNLAERWSWKVQFSDAERLREEDQRDCTQRPTT